MSNILSSMVVFHYILFRLEILFLEKFGPKNENCQFQLNFGTYSNSNIKKSKVVFLFLNESILFMANLLQIDLLKLKFGT